MAEMEISRTMYEKRNGVQLRKPSVPGEGKPLMTIEAVVSDWIDTFARSLAGTQAEELLVEALKALEG